MGGPRVRFDFDSAVYAEASATGRTLFDLPASVGGAAAANRSRCSRSLRHAGGEAP
jgi:hypothetical protein